jgi:hypothetical protein
VLAEIVRLASAAREQCFTWGPQQHQSTYDRIIAATMRYSAVVNYVGAIVIHLLPRHPASSSSSASTTASQPTPPTLVGGTTAATLHAVAVCSPSAGTFSEPYFQIMHTIIVCLWLYYILIVQGDRRSFRQPGHNSRTTPSAPPIFPLGGSRPSAFKFLATDIPSSSTRPMFQPAFDTTAEDEDRSVRGPVDGRSLV